MKLIKTYKTKNGNVSVYEEDKEDKNIDKIFKVLEKVASLMGKTTKKP